MPSTGFTTVLKNSVSVEKLSTPHALTGGSPFYPYPILVPGIMNVFRKPATKPSHCLPPAGHGLSQPLFVFTPRFPTQRTSGSTPQFPPSPDDKRT
jgi:hypothetical protein